MAKAKYKRGQYVELEAGKLVKIETRVEHDDHFSYGVAGQDETVHESALDGKKVYVEKKAPVKREEPKKHNPAKTKVGTPAAVRKTRDVLT